MKTTRCILTLVICAFLCVPATAADPGTDIETRRTLAALQDAGVGYGKTGKGRNIAVVPSSDIDSDTLKLLSTLPIEELILHGDAAAEQLKTIGPIKQLQSLSIDGKFTDADMLRLRDYPSLTWLNIRSSQVTNAGIKHLSEHKKLETLKLQQTKVTRAGLNELYKSLPKCVGSLD